MHNSTNDESAMTRLRDQIKVLEDLILFLTQQRGPVISRLAAIANHATLLAAGSAMTRDHADGLRRISCDAVELISHVHAEWHEIDRALMFVLESEAQSSASPKYIFPPAHNQ